MKTTLFTCAVAIAALSLTSCGSSKQPAAGAGDYQYQQFLAQQQKAAVETGRPAAPVAAEPAEAQQYAQRPKRTLREEDATVLLALEKSDHLRSYGDAVGFVESAVMDQAIMVAQERMSVLLKSALESAASNYTRNGNINLDNTSATLYESVTSRFSVNVSKDSRIIKRSVYDLDNGQVQIYVCIETGLSDNNLSKKLVNELSRDGFLGLQFDRDRFAKQNEQSLKEYREKLNQTAEEGE